MVICCLLSLIIIGSSIAFAVVTSLSTVGLTFSYLIAIACMVSARLRSRPLPPTSFSLGPAGIYINIIALCFLSVSVVMLLFPSVPNPDPASMNWACLIFGCVMIFSGVYYFFRARHKYVGPVEYVKAE